MYVTEKDLDTIVNHFENDDDDYTTEIYRAKSVQD